MFEVKKIDAERNQVTIAMYDVNFASDEQRAVFELMSTPRPGMFLVSKCPFQTFGPQKILDVETRTSGEYAVTVPSTTGMVKGSTVNTMSVMRCEGKHMCGFCLNESAKLHLCSVCRVTAYCGRECQKKDWPYHKKTVCQDKDFEINSMLRQLETMMQVKA